MVIQVNYTSRMMLKHGATAVGGTDLLLIHVGEKLLQLLFRAGHIQPLIGAMLYITFECILLITTVIF